MDLPEILSLTISVVAFLFSFISFYLTSLKKGKILIGNPYSYLIRLCGKPTSNLKPFIVVPLVFTNTGAVVNTITEVFGYLYKNKFDKIPFIMFEECDSIDPVSKPQKLNSFSISPNSGITKIISFHCIKNIDIDNVVTPFLNHEYNEENRLKFIEKLKLKTNDVIINTEKYTFDIYVRKNNVKKAKLCKSIIFDLSVEELWEFYTQGKPLKYYSAPILKK